MYDWVREYDYRVRPPDEHEHSYWLGFTESAVTYGRIYNRISTQRNSRIKATPGYARPSEVGPGACTSAPASLHEWRAHESLGIIPVSIMSAQQQHR